MLLGDANAIQLRLEPLSSGCLEVDRLIDCGWSLHLVIVLKVDLQRSDNYFAY